MSSEANYWAVSLTCNKCLKKLSLLRHFRKLFSQTEYSLAGVLLQSTLPKNIRLHGAKRLPRCNASRESFNFLISGVWDANASSLLSSRSLKWSPSSCSFQGVSLASSKIGKIRRKRNQLSDFPYSRFSPEIYRYCDFWSLMFDYITVKRFTYLHRLFISTSNLTSHFVSVHWQRSCPDFTVPFCSLIISRKQEERERNNYKIISFAPHVRARIRVFKGGIFSLSAGWWSIFPRERNWLESIAVLCRKASLSTDNEATMRRNCARRKHGCSLASHAG